MMASDAARSRAVSLRAHAKVNLSLRVLDRRHDGFHNIRSVMQTVSLCDTLRVSVRPGPAKVELTCDVASLNGRSNLAWRAADLLLRRSGARAGVTIELRKSIPVGAGLGGGSSDAAATLRAVAALLPNRPSSGLVSETAAALGSDVPFFLVGGTAVATGRGTRLQPLDDLPVASLVIARPPVEVSTAWAYGALATARGASDYGSSGVEVGGAAGDSASDSAKATVNGRGARASYHNDFEEVVFRRFPRIADLKRRLIAEGASRALMSGSGSAVFGVFGSSRRARAAARALRAAGFEAWPACYVGRVACSGAALDRQLRGSSGETDTQRRTLTGVANRAG